MYNYRNVTRELNLALLIKKIFLKEFWGKNARFGISVVDLHNKISI